jgi:uncharacterized protein YsxB (DUF464 family)
LITVTVHNVSYDEELRLPETDGSIVTIAIEGHAVLGGLFGETGEAGAIATGKGENIICAAVSFAGLNLIRSLTIIAGVKPDYTIENGSMRMSLDTGGLDVKRLTIVKILVEAFLVGMLDIERKYKSFITITIH